MGTKTFVSTVTLSLAALIFDLILAFAGQSPSARSVRLNTTADEMRRGNYFAWVQARIWLSRLTPEEKHLVQKACGEYAASNASLYSRGNHWPPEQSRISWRMQRLATELRKGLGLRDTSLAYDVMVFPATYQVPLTLFSDLSVSNAKR